jgi:succinate dehydrogenase/fumarate reductase flavoprotein subunit
MESEVLHRDRFEIRCHFCNTLVIGSGAAALNGAVSLHSMGQTDIIIATSKWGGGTSNNAGSDKQTYYKLSLSGDEADSVPAMAADLFNGHCMHGDIALCEAQGSVRAFMNLVSLGVEFPDDIYGAFAGYKTDHDPRSRATSAGPFTSKRMFETLAGEARRRRIKVLDRHQVVSLFTDPGKTRVTGALALNLKEKDPYKSFVVFKCENIILGTGGPAGMYETSVYPASQSGSTGMAFRAGAAGQNLTESQFGIASIKFRWNLSGSYQQVIPKYVSTDRRGKDRREFLNEHFPDFTTLTKAIFLKGYQWPFDPGKIENYGSSLIDVLVWREINEKNRRVFLDFTENPDFGSSESFPFEKIDRLAYTYLENSGALKESPVERLKEMNLPAYKLYKSHGIDLAQEMLEIAVCVQHNNGGLVGDIWWESNLRHLFPVGEVNGSHGVYRPGGSALNSGQVGSFRAARRIANVYAAESNAGMKLQSDFEQKLDHDLSLAMKWLQKENHIPARDFLSSIRKRMSSAAGISRELTSVSEAHAEAHKLTLNIGDMLGAGNVKDLAEAFQVMDHALTHYIYLAAIKEYVEKGGRSRGSYLVKNDGGGKELCEYDRDVEKMILEMSWKGGVPVSKMVKVRDIPDQDLWFEKVWKEYLKDNNKGC